MNLTLALTGMLPLVVVVASLLALPVSLGLLALYRRAVLRGMAANAGSASPRPAALAPPAAPPAPLQALRIERITAATVTDAGRGPAALAAATGAGRGPAAPAATTDAGRAPAALGAALAAPGRAWAAVALAGLAYAVVMTAGWLLATQDARLGPLKLAFMLWQYLWPVVLAAGVTAALDGRQRLLLGLAYAAVLAALTAAAVARNPQLGWVDLPRAWLFNNGPPTVLAGLVMLRRVRAVGPLVLVMLLLALLGSQLLVPLAGASDAVLRLLVRAGGALGLGGSGVFLGIMALGMLVFALLAWPLLRAIGRGYDAQRFSDQTVTLAALWLMFGLLQGMDLVFQGPTWLLAGPLAWGVWLVVLRRAGRWLRPAGAAPRTLLLLRVFRLGARSQGLFDRLRAHWLPIGPVRLIAGPDLATSAIEPHEFLGFVSGRLDRVFVRGEADLAQRLAGQSAQPDADGRHRVHEFFCHNDTWQAAVERLAGASDAVLMDLRSFGPGNAGCTWELGRLLSRVPLACVLLLADERAARGGGAVDAAADADADADAADFLDQTLQRLWREALDADSPNRADARPVLRVLEMAAPSAPGMRRLLALLLPD